MTHDDSALRGDPSPNPLEQAARHIDAGELSEARHILQDQISRIPWAVSARVLLARVSARQGRHDECLRIWREAAALCPSSPVVREGLQGAVFRRYYGDETVDLSAYEDLDNLIQELENAKIVPDPDTSSISLDAPVEDDHDVVSETLARIYENQNYLEEAADVYDKLAGQQPDRSEEFAARAAALRGGGRKEEAHKQTGDKTEGSEQTGDKIGGSEHAGDKIGGGEQTGEQTGDKMGASERPADSRSASEE